MASRVLSGDAYVTYLNTYVDRILNKTDRFLLESIDESYLDEIEEFARSILARWLSEQAIDHLTSLFIRDVGLLNNRLASLITNFPLKQKQIERIELLIWNAKTLSLCHAILQILFDSSTRHKDEFLRYLSFYLDVWVRIKSDNVLKQLCGKILRSTFYQQYLNEIMTSNIQAKHRFFLGTISQLAPVEYHSSLNELYIQYLLTFYDQMNISNSHDLHYCTRGILFQLDSNTCMENRTCLSVLLSIFYFASQHRKDYVGISILQPLFPLLIVLCVQSKTIACYMNTDDFIDVLLQYVPERDDHRFDIDACLLLGHVISEQQLIDLRITHKLMMKLIDLLSYSHHDKNGILASLHSLAIHRSVQMAIAQSYQLVNLIPWAEKYSIVYELIWTLSFRSEILQQLINRHASFLKSIESFDKTPPIIGILQNIEMKKRARVPYQPGLASYLHLVYSPKDLLMIKPIEEKLSEQGVQFGNLDNSPCVLLCISEESKHDSLCQATIRQALLECRKVVYGVVREPYRLDDWFGTLQIPEKSFFSLAQSPLSTTLAELVKALHPIDETRKRTRILSASKESSELSPSSSDEPPDHDVTRLPVKLFTKKIQSWSREEVQQWCQRENLTAFSKVLSLYDGRSLIGLAHVSRTNAPQTIINQLRNDCRKHGLRVPFVEFVRFQTALDQLLRQEKLMERKTSISTLATRYVYQSKIKSKK